MGVTENQIEAASAIGWSVPARPGVHMAAVDRLRLAVPLVLCAQG